MLTWIVVVAVALYVIECVVWPYTRCRWCRGSGKLRSPLTGAWRDCRCGGDGRSVRLGRRLFEVLSGRTQ